MGKREYNEARARANKKYQDAHTRINLVIDNREAELWKREAANREISLTQFVIRAVDDYIQDR